MSTTYHRVTALATFSMSSTSSCPPLWLRHCDANTKTPVSGTVQGTIPSWLNGRLIRNGPGGKRVGETHFNHLFDGMSVLHMVNIENGQASYTARYLESEAYKLNHRANRVVVSEFGTLGVPDPCLSLFGKFNAWFMPQLSKVASDNCSVNVLQVKDELLAMTETNSVRIVDPVTLDTKPGKLKYTKYVSCQRATAHPHVGEDSTVYNLGFSTGAGPPSYAILSLKDGKIQNAKLEASVPTRWKFSPGYMHSFGITENYYVLVESPLAFNVMQILLPAVSGATAASALKYYKDETTKFRIISRKTGEEVAANFVSSAFFNFHFFNCFETEGTIVVDMCATVDNIIDCLYAENLKKTEDDPTRKHTVAEPWRFVIPVENLDSAVAGDELLKDVREAKVSRENFTSSASAVKKENGDIFLKAAKISDSFVELPRINYKYNTKAYSYGYGACILDNKNMLAFGSIVKVNVRTGEEIKWQDEQFFTSEPVFVATPDATREDDGVLLSILLHKTNLRQLALVVLDAATLTETARADFTSEGTVSGTFHGQFIAADAACHAY